MYIVLTLQDNIIIDYFLCDIQYPEEKLENNQIEVFTTVSNIVKTQIGNTKYINGQFDFTNYDEVALKSKIREFRQYMCFDIVNRGQVWYNTLTENQKQELQTWYQAWLDAPETLIVPERPDWLS